MGSKVWYCHECGDGPLNLTLITGCPACYHDKCKKCKVETISNKRDTASNHLGSLITQTLTSSNAIVSTPQTHLGAHGPSVYAYDSGYLGEPTDGGEVVYRWTCCQCSGDNSYDYSPGCTDCSNHWRCGGCTVYGIKG